jgi:hypothetical protein
MGGAEMTSERVIPRFRVGEILTPKPGPYLALWASIKILQVFMPDSYGIDKMRYAVELTYANGEKDGAGICEEELLQYAFEAAV